MRASILAAAGCCFLLGACGLAGPWLSTRGVAAGKAAVAAPGGVSVEARGAAGNAPDPGRAYLNGIYENPPDPATETMVRGWDYTLNNAYQDDCAGCGISGLAQPGSMPVIVDLYHVQPSYPNFRIAAAGGYNALYRSIVKHLAAYAGRIYAIRVDSEFNGSWSAASAFKGWGGVSPAIWIAGYRNLAAAIHQSLPGIRIIWNPNIGQHDPFPYYPGDDAADLIGPDLYCQPRYFADSRSCWESFQHGSDGANLDAFAKFAAGRHKPLVIPEWGDAFGDGYMIRQMRAWMDGHAVVAQSYWDSGDGLARTAALPVLKENQRAYVEAFGKRLYTGGYWKPLISPHPVTGPR